MSIPFTTDSGAPLPQRDLILVLTTMVIVISLIVQGLTLEPLARFTGVARRPDAGHEETIARLRLAEAALTRLDELAGADVAPDEAIDRARVRLETRLGQARAHAAGAGAAEHGGLTDRQLGRDLIAAENAELIRLFDSGEIGDATRQRLQHSLDLEAARLGDGQP